MSVCACVCYLQNEAIFKKNFLLTSLKVCFLVLDLGLELGRGFAGRVRIGSWERIRSFKVLTKMEVKRHFRVCA